MRLAAVYVLMMLAGSLCCRPGFAQAPAPAPAAAANPPAVSAKELVVGIKEAPPFVIRRPDGGWTGISIDLWERLAADLHLRYRFQEKGLQELVDATAAGDLDVAIAALTVTAARQRVLDFTQPFYSTGIGVAVPHDRDVVWSSVLRTLLSVSFLRAVFALVGAALVVGLLIWLVEHRHNEHFGRSARGLGSSFWWSAMAMTQSANPNQTPMTLPGRFMATGWAVASVIAIATFTAAVTSQLTAKNLQGIVRDVNDLRSVRVGAIGGTATTAYLDRERIRFRDYANTVDGLNALKAGKLDAFAYDKPLLAYSIKQGFSDDLQMLDLTLDPQSYAIAVPDGSPLRIPLDMSLLEIIRSDWWHETLLRYLGKE